MAEAADRLRLVSRPWRREGSDNVLYPFCGTDDRDFAQAHVVAGNLVGDV